MTDIIVSHVETRNLQDRGPVTLLFFHRGHVLMIGGSAIGLYRDEQAISDPLGNGTLGYQAIPDALQPAWQEPLGFVREHLGGCVTLTSGAVVYIRLDGVALHDNGLDALNNRHCRWLIPFSSS